MNINYGLNPRLRGLNGLALVDYIVNGAGRRGLRVILDRHHPSADGQPELWYTAKVPDEHWIQDWLVLARRYRGNDAVIGADLSNEPHGAATWGDNLSAAAHAPVRLSHPERLVYSAHDYGPEESGQSWLQGSDFPGNLPGVWRSHWAYLQQGGIAPVLVGEFGGRSIGADAEGLWQRNLIDFLTQGGFSY